MTGRKPALFVTVGQRFGRGTVKVTDERVGPHRKRGAVLVCDCGNEYRTAISKLYSGHTRSCGCLHWETMEAERTSERQRQHLIEMHRTHGLSNHYLYDTWNGMMGRCYRESTPKFKYYGGRGISVYEPWRTAPPFIEWIETNLGPRPDGYTLDRIDNDGNYEPGNVRWASTIEQLANRRAAV